MMTDPVADMLTRIRNANRVERPFVEMPGTKLKASIARVLVEEGFILGFRIGKYKVNAETGENEFSETDNFDQAHVTLQVYLKYGSRRREGDSSHSALFEAWTTGLPRLS